MYNLYSFDSDEYTDSEYYYHYKNKKKNYDKTIKKVNTLKKERKDLLNNRVNVGGALELDETVSTLHIENQIKIVQEIQNIEQKMNSISIDQKKDQYIFMIHDLKNQL